MPHLNVSDSNDDDDSLSLKKIRTSITSVRPYLIQPPPLAGDVT
jgi:hypothetical protein